MPADSERTASETNDEVGSSREPKGGALQFDLPFAPGEILVDKYCVQKLIGTGGVGFVVAATHVGLDDSVALKFLKPEFATHPEAVARFVTEARACFKIKNEHVARVLDVDTLPDGRPFMVMELLEGRDLRSILEAHHYLPVELAVDLALQTCEALAAAHARQIVHRDIKPENLFVTQSGEDDHIKVLDFGISKVALTQQAQQPTRKTRATVLSMMSVGTPPYMSPEQVRAASDLDARSDIWSLGCVIYELLTSKAPFERMSLMQSCAAVLEDEPLPLRESCPEAPEALEVAVMRCLRKNPAERFADVAELAQALAPFGSRSVHCADRCAELLAEGIRRSDPGRVSEPLLRTTGVRISTRSGAVAQPRRATIPADPLAPARAPNDEPAFPAAHASQAPQAPHVAHGPQASHVAHAPHAAHAPHVAPASQARHAAHAPQTPHAAHAPHAPHAAHAPHLTQDPQVAHVPQTPHSAHAPQAPHGAHAPETAHAAITPPPGMQSPALSPVLARPRPPQSGRPSRPVAYAQPPIPPSQPRTITVDPSVEVLTEADLKPQPNNWILVAVGALTLLSGAYVAFRHAQQAERANSAYVTQSPSVLAPSPATPSTTISPEHPEPSIPEFGLPREPVQVAVQPARSPGATRSAEPPKPRASKSASASKAAKDEDPDVGF